MRPEEKQLNMLGLAQRAGKLVSGDEQVEEAIVRQQVSLVVIASDASDNTLKKYQNKCEYYGVPLNQDFTRYEISNAVGKSRSILGIQDRGMVKKFLSYRQESEESYEELK